MRVLQFGLTGDRYHQPHNYPPNSVAYTGTHDNDTIVGWFKSLTQRQRVAARTYLGDDRNEINWLAIRELYRSPANLAIVPMQDVLGLGSRARMNVPGTPKGNWRWRLRGRELEEAPAQRLAELARTYQRSEAGAIS
jgi:4-alpha-glucanotransferase